MSKSHDFSSDLSLVAEGVAVGVNDMLQALRQKSDRPAKTVEAKEPPTERPSAAQQPEPQIAEDSGGGMTTARPRRYRPQPKEVVALTGRVAKERFTTRLRPETKERLEEAKNWQKVKRQIPDDYEDILDEALTDWFRKMGYVK